MLAARLRLLREGLGVTQKEFATKFKMSDARYNQYETGKRTPDYQTLCLFADFFGVTTDYLLGNSDIKEPKQIEVRSNPLIEKIESLSKENQRELEKYLELLQIKEQIDKSKEDSSSTLEKDA